MKSTPRQPALSESRLLNGQANIILRGDCVSRLTFPSAYYQGAQPCNHLIYGVAMGHGDYIDLHRLDPE